MPVLFEREAPKSIGGRSKNSSAEAAQKFQLWGKSPWLQSVIIDVENEDVVQKYLGQIAQVKILQARPSSLVGELL